MQKTTVEVLPRVYCECQHLKERRIDRLQYFVSEQLERKINKVRKEEKIR